MYDIICVTVQTSSVDLLLLMYVLHDLQYVNDVNPKELVKYRRSGGISKIQARIQKFFKEGGG